MNYYNEIDPSAVAWLRELIGAGLIPDGHIDTRSISEVQPQDLYGYAQCHFFAGIAGWPLALQLAEWTGPVWTGSCPCQPFSSAGRQRGTADERHLWPDFFRLIAECRPATVFGEQVASKLGREWLSGVRADLEGVGYAVGAADLCAAGVGAPHIRQRLYWVADLQPPGLEGHAWDGNHRDESGRVRTEPVGPVAEGRGVGGVEIPGPQQPRGCVLGPGEGPRSTDERAPDQFGGPGDSGGVADSDNAGYPPVFGSGASGVCAVGVVQRTFVGSERGGAASGVDNPPSARQPSEGRWESGEPEGRRGVPSMGREGGPWSRYDLLPFRDGKTRRVESGTFPLAHGVSGRVGLLRGYGNAIVPQVAEAFIRAFVGVR